MNDEFSMDMMRNIFSRRTLVVLRRATVRRFSLLASEFSHSRTHKEACSPSAINFHSRKQNFFSNPSNILFDWKNDSCVNISAEKNKYTFFSSFITRASKNNQILFDLQI